MNWIQAHLVPIGLGVALILAGALLAWQSYDTNQRAERQADNAASAEVDEIDETAAEAEEDAQDAKEDPKAPKEEAPAPTVKPAATTGLIEGSLTYPSEGIPSGLKICAKNTVNNTTTCTTKHINNAKYIYDKGYKITVKAGNYRVYAVNPVDNQPAYYNSYMKALASTGQWGDYPTSCNSLSPMVLSVAAGKSYFDIAVGDWYYGDQCN